jgi:hypothetical protein
MTWLDPLAAALDAEGGCIVSGGTRQGVSALAAELAQKVPGWRSVGYLPSVVPVGVAVDDRYDELRHTHSEEFGLAEHLAFWTDLLASDIVPSQVHVLGIGGGSLTRLELHLATELGAHVALADVSGGPGSPDAGENAAGRPPELITGKVAELRAWLTT